MSKRYSKLVACVLFAVVLLGASMSFAQAADANLKLYFWDETFTDVTQETIDAFEALNPDIEIEATCLPWGQYWVKIPTLLRSGSDLDLFWANMPNGFEFAQKGWLLSLDDSKISTAGFTASTIGPFTDAAGKVYGVPIFYDCSGIMYNKTLFDAAGLPYPTDDWTWDDLREAAKKLTIRDANGEVTQWGIHIGTDSDTFNVFYAFLYAGGSDIYSDDGKTVLFNNPQAVAAMQYVYDVVNVDKSSPSTQEAQELSGPDLFTSGKVAMILDTTPDFANMFAVLGEQVDCIQRPAGVREGTPLSAIAYVASKNTKYPEAVQRFMDYLVTDEPNLIMAKKNTPALPSATEEWAKNFPNSNTDAWIAPLSSGTSFATPVVFQQNSEVWSLVGSGMNYMMSGQVPIEQGLADLAAQIEALQK